MAVYLIASGSYVGFQLHISIKLHSNCNFKNFNSALDVAMNLHPHAVLSRVLWRWYRSPSGFKSLQVFCYLTFVPVSPFGPFPAGRTYAGPSIGPLSVGIFHSTPSGIPVAVFYTRRPRWSSFQPFVSGYARNRKSSVPSHALGNAFLRMFAAPLQSALIL